MTYLCVPILVKDAAQTRRDAALAAEAGADLVELRLDQVEYGVAANAFEAACLPAIVTCRPTSEGGSSTISDLERLELLQNFVGQAAFFDLELATVERLAMATGNQLEPTTDATRKGIISSHDFIGRPDRLYNIIAEMNDLHPAVNKIVWTARSIRDNLEAFEILQTRQRPTIALCMGEAGLLSRVLAKKFGAFLTFASLTSDSGTAPGQVTIDEMKRLYRWDAINPATKVYGVVASPVKHSMSPAIHNAGFDAVGHDGVYLPMLVEPSYESFKAFIETFRDFPGLNLSGLSITIPHKENALRYLKEKCFAIEPLAEQIGAVNTFVFGESGIRGINTDYAAILDTITTALSIQREQLADMRIAILGAGGTGRTAVAALAAYGATVVVYNRTFEKAQSLAAEFTGKSGKVVAARWEKLCDTCCSVLINTTPIGMHPNIDVSPLDEQTMQFTSDQLVFDTIYNPMKTKLLRTAEAAGAKTVGGVEMFVRQAAVQFQSWTGVDAPMPVMRHVVESKLAAAQR